MHHVMIQQLTQNGVLLSKMYSVVGLFWIFTEFILFQGSKLPILDYKIILNLKCKETQ